jgi:hypothetical protein
MAETGWFAFVWTAVNKLFWVVGLSAVVCGFVVLAYDIVMALRERLR